MSVPTYSDLKNLAFDRAQVNVVTAAPVDDPTFARFMNQAGRDVWEMSGGRVKSAAGARAWDLTSNANGNGTFYGLLADIAQPLHIFATTTAPRAIVCGNTTAGSAAITSATLFGDGGAALTPVAPGMEVSGTPITAGTQVRSVTTTSAATLTQSAAAATAPTLTFSPLTGPYELEQKDEAEIRFWRENAVRTYVRPKLCAIVRPDSNSVIANANLLRLEVWPWSATIAAQGWYLPIEYRAQWVDIDGTTNTTPNLDDVWANDAGLLCASRLAQALGRNDLVPGIVADYSDRMADAMERKLKSGVDAMQAHRG